MRDEYALYNAKAKLSALIRQVREGRTIIITVHGEPAAELRPIEKGTRKQSLAERIAELESCGELSASTRKPGISARVSTVARRRGALTRFLKDRDE